MTTELQRAMARYEEARMEYRKAVLASLNGASRGDAIRRAIEAFQAAGAEVKRLQAKPPPLPPRRSDEPAPAMGWSYVTRLIKAG
jgi:hypothetical protein